MENICVKVAGLVELDFETDESPLVIELHWREISAHARFYWSYHENVLHSLFQNRSCTFWEDSIIAKHHKTNLYVDFSTYNEAALD